MNTINEVLKTKEEAISLNYQEYVASLYKELTEEFTNKFNGIYNSGCGNLFKEAIKPVCDYDKGCTRPGETVYTLSKEKLKVVADKYATLTVLAWQQKIVSKIGNITDIQCHSLNSTGFYITGKLGTLNVRVEQNIIVNVSSKGKLFNQFPARIYVDGKAISEAKFKKLTII